MLVCTQCRFQNHDTNKFCQKCGTSLSPKICEQCGTQVPLSAEYCPNCGTTTKKKTGSIIGQLLDGRYQVVRALSKGAFGHTYVAQDTRIPGGRSCVIKHLQPESKDPRTLEKAKDLFHQEAEILAKLGSHNQIPTLWDYFAPDQEFYLVQEFIDGHPLRDEMIPAQKWTESQVISLLQDVLSILVFVHDQGDEGVIHRDIKPENIMRRQQDNKLVLIDFGAIKKVRSQQSNPGGQMGSVIAGTRIGTFGYAPPEQNIGKPRVNSDIYALGMVAIEALTGKYPGNLNYDDNTHELLWQHLVSVSTGLAAVLTQMVRSRWQDRYQSASEVLQALQQLGNSPHTPTVQATVLNTAQSTPAHELTLEWVKAGQARSQTIRNQQRSKNLGTVRIGRDPAQCDILLSDLSVSGLHVEIFFNQKQQRFYVRNLRETNPPVVDGRSLPNGEAVLNRGSNLRLGQIDLRVTAINLGQAGGVAPKQSATATKRTEAATAHQSSAATPVAPTQNPAAGVNNDNDANDYIQRGKQLIEQKDYQQAIQILDLALRLNPNDAEAYKYRGCAHKELFQFSQAIEDFNLALRLNPSDAELHMYRDNAREQEDDMEGAITDYTLAVEYHVQGVALSELGDYQGAIADFEKALQLCSDNKFLGIFYTQDTMKDDILFNLEDARAKLAEETNPQPQNWRCINTLNAHSSSFGQGVSSIAFSPDGEFIASGGVIDNKVKVFNLKNLSQVITLSGHKAGVRAVAFCPDGRLFSGSDDKTIKIWNWAQSQEINTLNLHSKAVTSIAWSPNNRYFTSCSDDKTVYIEDTDKDESLIIKAHESYVQYVAFSDDSEYIASASCDQTSKVWELGTIFKAFNDTSEVSSTYFTGHNDYVICVQFSPQDEILATGGHDGKIMLWNYKTKQSIYDIAAHSSGTLNGVAVAFSPDGKILASGGPDNLIKIWHVKTGKQLVTLSGHSKAVTSIAFSPDGKILASGSGDGTIKLWQRQ